ncbi:MAG TPA: hypothetical protein VKR55_24825 [Bradyrhizobium sp.]|uniref:hypothetical protein n=1 Tax=Bradyrhizobium sp. TaxID=376 RepID=UPI002CDF6B41|nr:hypothetical protein [Bradyrhizobium sp.]HLZ05359.1 hypothetical protein [Bradyrhizobium sp.]
MRSALLPAALVALLGLIVDARPLSAQFAQPQWAAPQPPWAAPMPPAQAAPAQTTVPSVERARTARTAARTAERTAIRRARPAHKKRQAVRLPPNLRKLAERDGYKRLSDLVNFPKFFPGLGILFVKPDTLPLGPFLCFDRNDRLIATLYMVSIKDIEDHKSFEAPAPAFAAKVDHITHYFNAGHPGMDMPHYHVVLWHVSKQEESRVAQ